MKGFLFFLRSEAPLLLGFLSLCGCFAVVFYLYELPVEALLYGGVLCACFIAVLTLCRGVRQRARCRKIVQVCRMELPDAAELPEPGSMTEAAYAALAETLCTALRAQETAFCHRVTDLKEYYTLWAHQIKTPIAAMRLLLQSEDTDRSRALRDELFHVEKYVEMALTYLRLDEGTHDWVLRAQPLDPMIRAAVRQYAGLFIRSKLQLEYEAVDCEVLTDAKALTFVIGQILSNALKYTPRGKVSITLEAGKVLVIRDTGIGIAPEDLPRVCEKGFTGYNGRTDRASTGIGLYLCKRILTLLGHQMKIESTVHEGTTVRLLLDSMVIQPE